MCHLGPALFKRLSTINVIVKTEFYNATTGEVQRQ